MRVLVTGANGFVGRHLVPALARRGFAVVAAVRETANAPAPIPNVSLVAAGDLESRDRFDALLAGIDAVVHLAARVHVMNDTGPAAAARYRRTNADVTQRLAAAAAAADCRHFVFVSSIKVNGERTTGSAFKPDDKPAPADPYAASKLAAETALLAAASASAMTVSIVRPPLVYGPCVGGNFDHLLRLIARGVWLPLGAIDNRRSLLSVNNLCDFLGHALSTGFGGPVPALISDAADFSTPELVERLARALGVRPRMFRVPVGVLRAAGSVFGFRDRIDRICESLVVDPGPTMSRAGWRPPEDPDTALRATAAWYSARHA